MEPDRPTVRGEREKPAVVCPPRKREGSGNRDRFDASDGSEREKFIEEGERGRKEGGFPGIIFHLSDPSSSLRENLSLSLYLSRLKERENCVSTNFSLGIMHVLKVAQVIDTSERYPRNPRMRMNSVYVKDKNDRICAQHVQLFKCLNVRSMI